MSEDDTRRRREREDRDARKRRHDNAELDEALEETFPASDPPAPVQPVRDEP